MANSKEFSHITVTADDDDDVVIQAGAVQDADDVVAEADEAVFEDAGGGEEAVAEESLEAVAAPSEREALDEPTSPSAPRADEPAAAYHETTLDDLESTKMSTTQKVIIVVAVLGVIAFAAWYLLAH